MIILMAKAAIAGRVKTRLSPVTSESERLLLARAFFRDTRRQLCGRNEAPLIVATPQAKVTGLAHDPRHPLWPQAEGDLGVRLEKALQRALSNTRWAIAVGSDHPTLDPSVISEAIRALETGSEAVLGPTVDGGFYLIGLRQCPPGLLDNLPWSQDNTFAATRARLEGHGYAVHILTEGRDIDTPKDLEWLKQALKTTPHRAPHSASVLTRGAYRRGPYRVSVIIPTLNEAQQIGQRLREHAAMPEVHEVIVCDGGSDDQTRALVEDSDLGVLVTSLPGRARQMNAAAKLATGDVLCFQHADVQLPIDAVAHINLALHQPHVVGGAFKTWTLPEADRRHLGPLLHLADLRSRYTKLPYGDQAIFVRSEAFKRCGGFPDQALMEDLEFSSRIRGLGSLKRVSASVKVSGRRFQDRPIYYTLAVNLFPLAYRLGVSPATLARAYAHSR